MNTDSTAVGLGLNDASPQSINNNNINNRDVTAVESVGGGEASQNGENNNTNNHAVVVNNLDNEFDYNNASAEIIDYLGESWNDDNIKIFQLLRYNYHRRSDSAKRQKLVDPEEILRRAYYIVLFAATTTIQRHVRGRAAREEFNRFLTSKNILNLARRCKKHATITLQSMLNKLARIQMYNSAIRGELVRASEELALSVSQLSVLQRKATTSRRNTIRVDKKLQSIAALARSLVEHRRRVDLSLARLANVESTLISMREEERRKLGEVILRRNDAVHCRATLVAAIRSNTFEEERLDEETSGVRADTETHEQELIVAQQEESKAGERLLMIKREMNNERARHTNAVADLETTAAELDNETASFGYKKAMVEAKKAELRKVWERCNELRKSEGQDGTYTRLMIMLQLLYAV